MAGLEPLQHREVLAHRVELAAYGAGPFDHAHAELGRHGAPPAAHQQLHAELGLELVHVARDVRLHGVQAIGRRRERALLGNREQGLQMTNVHRRGLRPAGNPGCTAICLTDRSYREKAFDR